jgi:hypothetical protein
MVDLSLVRYVKLPEAILQYSSSPPTLAKQPKKSPDIFPRYIQGGAP